MVSAGHNVLIIEDDESMRAAVERLLNLAGYRPRAFESAEAMLESTVASDSDCIVCDFKLPGMSAFDLLAALRANGGWPPMIVITAHDAPGMREEAQQRGAAGYLAKPFRGNELLAAIDAIPLATSK